MLATDVAEMALVCDMLATEEDETILDDELEVPGSTIYIFRRLLPPQYSNLLASQIMLQPLTFGSVLL